jgi:nitrite reductase/ring-hydroxylating ferredoxin subunit
VSPRAGAIDVGPVELFPQGRLTKVEIPGKDVLVLRTPSDEFFAIRNRCPHRGHPLLNADVDGTFLPSDPGEYQLGLHYRVLRCPYHGHEFDLETGREMFTGLADRLVRYGVEVRNGRVLVDHAGH